MGSTRRGWCVIAAAPEAAAEAGVGLTFTLALVSALMFVVLVGLKGGWKYTIGYLIEQIAETKINIKWAPDIHPFRFLRAVNDTVMNALGDAAAGYEHAMGFWFHETARLQIWIAEETWSLARDAYHFGGWLVHSYIPTYVHGVTNVIHTTVNTTQKVVHVTETKVINITKTVYVTAKNAAVTTVPRVALPHVGEWKWIHEHWKALTKAVAAAGGLALPRPVTWPEFRRTWKEIEAWRKTTAKRLARLEALLAASGLALAVANMTGTRVGCWRGRGNVARLLRGVCGAPTWLLDLLLVGALEGFIAADLCGFTDLLIKEAESFKPALLELVDVEDALIGCNGTVKPIDFALPALSLPPMPAPSILAA